MGYIGIDIGSSYIKAAYLDVEKFEISEIEKHKSPGFVRQDRDDDNNYTKEVDADAVLAIVKNIIDGYVVRHNNADSGNGSNTGIEGVLFSTQMHGFILVDGDRGTCVTNYITWQDERSLMKPEGSNETYLKKLEKLVDNEDIRKSGTRLKPSLAICNLYHWKSNNGTCGMPLQFCTLGDYIIMRLTGEKPTCHITNAASTGMVDLIKGSWNMDMINKLGFGGISFPKIIKEDVAGGIYKTAGKEIPLYPAVGDHQAAVYGTFLRPEKDLAINMGTGSQLCLVSRELTLGDYETRPFFEGMYLRAITHIPGGRALDVLVNFIKDIGEKIFGLAAEEKDIWNRLDRYLAENSKNRSDEDSEDFLKMDFDDNEELEVGISFFKTSVLPYGGFIKNINSRNLTAEGLFQAAMKGMAENYHMLHKRVLADGDVLERIICAGGLARKNPAILKLIAGKFGLPVSYAPYQEDTLIGLLRLAEACSKNTSANN